MTAPPAEPLFADSTIRDRNRRAAWGAAAGCGAVTVSLLLCVGAGTYFAVKVVGEGLEQATARSRMFDATAAWNPPPADRDPADLFPAAVAGYERTVVDRETANPIFGVDLPGGAHAVYERGGRGPDGADGPGTVQAYVYRADRTAGWASIAAVEGVLGDDDRFPNHGVYSLGDALLFRVEPSDAMPAMGGMLVHGGDWLVFVRSGDDPDVAAFTLALLSADEMNDPAAVGRGRGAEAGSTAVVPGRPSGSGSVESGSVESGSVGSGSVESGSVARGVPRLPPKFVRRGDHAESGSVYRGAESGSVYGRSESGSEIIPY